MREISSLLLSATVSFIIYNYERLILKLSDSIIGKFLLSSKSGTSLFIG